MLLNVTCPIVLLGTKLLYKSLCRSMTRSFSSFLQYLSINVITYPNIKVCVDNGYYDTDNATNMMMNLNFTTRVNGCIMHNNFTQRITISITWKFVSRNFSIDQLGLNFLNGDALLSVTYLSYKYKLMIWQIVTEL